MLLAYTSVALMVYTKLQPYGALQVLFGAGGGSSTSDEIPQRDASFWITALRSEEGLFLHVRHAARIDSVDTQGFDRWELSRGEPSDMIEDFVCLTPEGKSQAELLQWAFQELDVSLFVVSSPSCRARQTAEISAGTIDVIDIAHLYPAAIPESQRPRFDIAREEFFAKNLFSEGRTVVIFGHEAQAYEGVEWVSREDGPTNREPGGISILSWDSSSEILTVHYTFPRITDFVLAVSD